MKVNNPTFLFKKQKWEYIYDFISDKSPSGFRKGKPYWSGDDFEEIIKKVNNEFTRRYNIDGNKFWEELKEYYRKTQHLSPK